jgi:hypothetical protein
MFNREFTAHQLLTVFQAGHRMEENYFRIPASYFLFEIVGISLKLKISSESVQANFNISSLALVDLKLESHPVVNRENVNLLKNENIGNSLYISALNDEYMMMSAMEDDLFLSTRCLKYHSYELVPVWQVDFIKNSYSKTNVIMMGVKETCEDSIESFKE